MADFNPLVYGNRNRLCIFYMKGTQPFKKERPNKTWSICLLEKQQVGKKWGTVFLKNNILTKREVVVFWKNTSLTKI